ncbi:AAA domain-containing protein [Micromonospora sp. IBSANI012]|uniref:AAA domain-containing protein n=1 Tax=Micromonospora sp. IBSANI012 TaxID=3457761 RepID=UPI0040594183
MLTELALRPAVEAERMISAVVADLRCGERRGVVVDSPPGAGKSNLVVRAAVELAAAGEPLIVIAPTNEQVDDLVDRLARQTPAITARRRGRPSTATAYLVWGYRHGRDAL